MTKQTYNPFQSALSLKGSAIPAGSGLTPREEQILALIGKGKTSKEIAAILNLSTATIGNHRKGICRKLDIHSTAELVYRAAVGDRL